MITNFISHLMEKMYKLVKFKIIFCCSNTFCRHPPQSGSCKSKPIGPNGLFAIEQNRHEGMPFLATVIETKLKK